MKSSEKKTAQEIMNHMLQMPHKPHVAKKKVKKKPAEKPRIHYVDVAADGALQLNRQPTTLANLPPLLKALKQAEADPSVVVRGADEVNYEHIVGVIDLL